MASLRVLLTSPGKALLHQSCHWTLPKNVTMRSLSRSCQPLFQQRKSQSSLTESKQDAGLQTSFAKAAKENVKTASYGAIIVTGLGVTGFILYTIFQELFSGDSPNSLFNSAAEKCIAHPKVQDLLGEPIKSFGEETRRGRRRHVSSLNYVAEDGKKGVRVQFYLQGIRKKATCQIDARENDSGHMETRFIIVTAEDMFRTTIVVEDNR